MTRAGALRVLTPILLALMLAGCGSAEVKDDRQRERLDAIRQATLKYRNRALALDEGYRPQPRCVESSDGDSALGLVYLHLERARDQQIDLLQPELLFYEERPGGRPPVLAGVGYFVPDEGQKPPSSPLGHLDGPIPGQFPGQVSRYELHIWVHRHNPDGVLALFNPDVKCL